MTISLTQATLTDFPTVEKMVPFYIYDVSRYCNWPWEDGDSGYHNQRVLDNVKRYFEEEGRYPFLIKVDGELAGFVLIKKGCWTPNIDWYIGEFFIIARFQGVKVEGKSIAATAINQLWDMYPGKWQLEVIPKNTRALHFWRRAIHAYSQGKFKEILDFVDYTPDPKVIFRFDTQNKNPEPVIHIRQASASDIPVMVKLSHEKRRAYEKVQPTFWRHAKGAKEAQTMWFNELLIQDGYILLVAESEKMIAGFIIGRLMNAPEVYDPGGLTIMIDDFCVRDPSQWVTIGHELLARIKEIAKDKCAVQIVFVCGAHDEHKRHFLKQDDLTIASKWYVGRSAS